MRDDKDRSDMTTARIAAMARHFPENGMKLLLEDPRNVRDLLRLRAGRLASLIDFERLKCDSTTYVERDYRHIEADVVLRGPLQRRRGERTRQTVLVYILIEHQSEPDRLMVLRMLEYVVQIYKGQLREASRGRRTLADVWLNPVLPVIFYTGERAWDSPGRLVDLIRRGGEFAGVTPVLEPLFINLGTVPAGALETEGGFFGWVLRLVRQRHAEPREFRALLRQAVTHLEGMPKKERLRWLELLSYVHALVYHDRDPREHADLVEAIESSVASEENKREVIMARRTIADELKEEGMKVGELRAKRETLARLLQKRFKKVPAGTLTAVETTEDIERLREWLDRFATAETLADVGIPSAR